MDGAIGLYRLSKALKLMEYFCPLLPRKPFISLHNSGKQRRVGRSGFAIEP